MLAMETSENNLEFLHLLLGKDQLYTLGDLSEEDLKMLRENVEAQLAAPTEEDSASEAVQIPKVPQDFHRKLLVLCQSASRESLPELDFSLLSNILLAIKLDWADIRVYGILPSERLMLKDLPNEVSDFSAILGFGINPRTQLGLAEEIFPDFLHEIADGRVGLFTASLQELRDNSTRKRKFWNGLRHLPAQLPEAKPQEG